MSAPRRFSVNLMVGRTLSMELEARDEQAAEDISNYLWVRFGDRFFASDRETAFDCIVNPAQPESPVLQGEAIS
jgi:hypothetical protein